MKPDFKQMTRKELKAYVLEYREDDEAFHEFMDRLQSNRSSKTYPCPNTPETEEITRQAIKQKIEELNQSQNS